MVREKTTLQVLRKLLVVLLAAAAILAACAPAQTTQSPEQIQAMVATSVAMTMDAQNQIASAVAMTVEAQNAQALPVLPTATSTSTAESSGPFPTLTPVLVIPTVAPSGGGGGGSTSTKPPQYACSVIDQVPQDNSPATILKLGDSLDVRWTIRNDGTKTWENGSPWSFYSSAIDTNEPANYGLTMSSIGLNTGLTADVKPGGTVTLGIEMHAPSSFEGRNPIYITTSWVLVLEGSKKYCHPWINIEVIRPGMTP